MTSKRSELSGWSVGAALLGAFVLAVVTAGLGPEDTVICGRGHILNRIAQAIMQRLGAGHIDGPSANYCVVPSTTAWLLAVVAFVAVVAVVFLVKRRPKGSPVGAA